MIWQGRWNNNSTKMEKRTNGLDSKIDKLISPSLLEIPKLVREMKRWGQTDFLVNKKKRAYHYLGIWLPGPLILISLRFSPSCIIRWWVSWLLDASFEHVPGCLDELLTVRPEEELVINPNLASIQAALFWAHPGVFFFIISAVVHHQTGRSATETLRYINIHTLISFKHIPVFSQSICTSLSFIPHWLKAWRQAGQ